MQKKTKTKTGDVAEAVIELLGEVVEAEVGIAETVKTWTPHALDAIVENVIKTQLSRDGTAANDATTAGTVIIEAEEIAVDDQAEIVLDLVPESIDAEVTAHEAGAGREETVIGHPVGNEYVQLFRPPALPQETPSWRNGNLLKPRSVNRKPENT
jgi:hypothetical protein